MSWSYQEGCGCDQCKAHRAGKYRPGCTCTDCRRHRKDNYISTCNCADCTQRWNETWGLGIKVGLTAVKVAAACCGSVLPGPEDVINLLG